MKARFARIRSCWTCKLAQPIPGKGLGCDYVTCVYYGAYVYNDAIVDVELVPGDDYNISCGEVPLPMHVFEILSPMEELVLEI